MTSAPSSSDHGEHDAPSQEPPSSEKRGGLLLREGQRLYFLPAAVTVSVDAMPQQVVRVPGAPAQVLGISTHEGEVLPLVSIGDDRSTVVVCRFLGELLGLVGAKVVGVGLFERASGSGDAISFLGDRAETIDLSEIHMALQGGAWATRWGG